MGPNETYKLLHSKGNHKQHEKTTYGMGEIFANDLQGLNFQNIQTAHTNQHHHQKHKSNNGQKT